MEAISVEEPGGVSINNMNPSRIRAIRYPAYITFAGSFLRADTVHLSTFARSILSFPSFNHSIFAQACELPPFGESSPISSVLPEARLSGNAPENSN
jgi:hypothetical protein